MRNVYLSFLGTGKYEKATYVLAGRTASPTRFIQAAQFELLDAKRPDQAYILVTKESRQKHFAELRNELESFAVQVQDIELSNDMSEHGQWSWFETILQLIQPEDRLVVDLTHGFRSMPIIFATALNFLQKTRKVTLDHVFYGAFEQNPNQPPIIDMRSFFDINLWADGVTRLVEDADASALARTAEISPKKQFSELSDDHFTKKCRNITRLLKSIDVNNIGEEVQELLEKICSMREHASPGTSILLEMMEEKFSRLQVAEMSNPDKNGYTLSYYKMLLELCRLLLDHGLIMQAFTVMREWIALLVMLYFEQQEHMNAGKRRKRVEHYSPFFFNMIQYDREKWNFPESAQKKLQRLEPFYDTLADHHILDPLLLVEPTATDSTLPIKRLSVYRNGFDHAWLGKSGMQPDMEEQARVFLSRLEDVLQRLERYYAKQAEQ